LDYSKFYTPPHIASLLVKELTEIQPDTIIDICCGSCNLLHAAGKRWKKAKLFGVDVVKHDTSDVCFTHMDGRKFAIEHSAKYALVLANPPFDCVEKEREFSELYSGIFSKIRTRRLEIEMLLANLFLMQDNGTLLIIMPSTFVEATGRKTIRKLVGENYYVKSIIKLPEDTFGASHINSYALVIKHCTAARQVTNYYSLIYANQEGHRFSSKKIVSQKHIKNGDWMPFMHLSLDADLDMHRGNISSQAFVSSGTPVLHTAKRSRPWMPSVRYIERPFESAVYAECGDIIISRIGKSAGQWCQYNGKRMPISDCLYCLKDPDGSVLERLGNKEYDFPQKGVATRYITMKDFVSWYSSIANP